MGYIGSMIAAVVVFIGLLWLGKILKRSKDEDTEKIGKVLKIVAPIIFVLWIGIHTVVASVYQVPAGNIGVVYEFGAIKGQIPEGFQVVAPWRKVVLANVQIQRHKFDQANQLVCFSQETQTVFVQASLNIRVTPEAIQNLFRDVGPDYFEKLVVPRVTQNFKDETVKYKSVDIAPNREQMRKVVSDRLEKELAPYSIQVVDLLLDNIDFSNEFEKAIENKQIATQRSLEEEQKVVMERHKAEQVLEKARGEGNAILAVAEKQAEANKKLSDSLTPILVQYALIQKLGPNIQVIMLPAGQNFILSPEMLKPQEKPEEK